MKDVTEVFRNGLIVQCTQYRLLLIFYYRVMLLSTLILFSFLFQLFKILSVIYYKYRILHTSHQYEIIIDKNTMEVR